MHDSHQERQQLSCNEQNMHDLTAEAPLFTTCMHQQHWVEIQLK